ncbi:hypothetical protein JCM8547_003533 [Rhodosporidiobolus lusitaniae]
MTSPRTTALVSTKGGTDEDWRKGEEGQRESEDLVVAVSSESRDEEDEERKEDDGVANGSAFDKVPDELLDQILSFFFTDFARSSADLAPSIVSKRIYVLARARWALSPWQINSSVTSRFVPQRDLHHFVRKLYIHVKNDEPAHFMSRMAVASIFTKLEEVVLTGGCPRGDFEFPSLFVNFLKNLERLRRLDFDLYSSIKFPTSFTFATDLPHLRDLRFCNNSRSFPDLLGGEHTLRALELDMALLRDGSGLFLSWRSLRRFKVDFSRYHPAVEAQAVRELAASSEAHLNSHSADLVPLKTLLLLFPSLHTLTLDWAPFHLVQPKDRLVAAESPPEDPDILPWCPALEPFVRWLQSETAVVRFV